MLRHIQGWRFNVRWQDDGGSDGTPGSAQGQGGGPGGTSSTVGTTGAPAGTGTPGGQGATATMGIGGVSSTGGPAGPSNSGGGGGGAVGGSMGGGISGTVGPADGSATGAGASTGTGQGFGGAGSGGGIGGGAGGGGAGGGGGGTSGGGAPGPGTTSVGGRGGINAASQISVPHLISILGGGQATGSVVTPGTPSALSPQLVTDLNTQLSALAHALTQPSPSLTTLAQQLANSVNFGNMPGPDAFGQTNLGVNTPNPTIADLVGILTGLPTGNQTTADSDLGQPPSIATEPDATAPTLGGQAPTPGTTMGFPAANPTLGIGGTPQGTPAPAPNAVNPGLYGQPDIGITPGMVPGVPSVRGPGSEQNAPTSTYGNMPGPNAFGQTNLGVNTPNPGPPTTPQTVRAAVINNAQSPVAAAVTIANSILGLPPAQQTQMVSQAITTAQQTMTTANYKGFLQHMLALWGQGNEEGESQGAPNVNPDPENMPIVDPFSDNYSTQPAYRGGV